MSRLPSKPTHLVVDVQATDGNRRYCCGDSRDTNESELSSILTPSDELLSEGSAEDCLSPTEAARASLAMRESSGGGPSRPETIDEQAVLEAAEQCQGEDCPLADGDPEPTALHAGLHVRVDFEDASSSQGLRSPLSDASIGFQESIGDLRGGEQSFAFAGSEVITDIEPADRTASMLDPVVIASPRPSPEDKDANWTSLGEVQVEVLTDSNTLQEHRSPSPAVRPPAMMPELASSHSPAGDGPSSCAAINLPQRAARGRLGAFVSRSTMDAKFMVGRGGGTAASVPTVMDREVVAAPLAINQRLADRIQSLGEKLPGTQRVMLWVGIVLDIASKISLIRELKRFSGEQPLWMGMVLLFLLISSIILTNYWLAHYHLDTALPERSNQAAPRVYGFTKNDVRLLVRRTGAIFAFLQLGTVFAALRSLNTREEKQRTVAMDLRGMRLVDGLFLTMSLAILQTYIGITCKSTESCPGREGFDFFLAFSVISSLFSGTLAFLALDFNDVKAKKDIKQKDFKHVLESVAFFLFRLCELSCRAALLALFAASFQGKVFIVLFVHAMVIILAIRFFPACKGVWEKATATKRWAIPCPCSGRVSIPIPVGNDMQLVVACLAWPPSCFVSDATDLEGRFWWRGDLRVGRRSFWSLNAQDGILPFQLFEAIMACEATIMIAIMYYVGLTWAEMYLKACMGLFVLWCFFGMVWSSTVYSHTAQRLMAHENALRPSFRRKQEVDDLAASPERGTGMPPDAPLRQQSAVAADIPTETCERQSESVQDVLAGRGHQTVPPGFTMDPSALQAFTDRAPAAPVPPAPTETRFQLFRRLAKGNKKGKENYGFPRSQSLSLGQPQNSVSAVVSPKRQPTATPASSPSPSPIPHDEPSAARRNMFIGLRMATGSARTRSVTPPANGVGGSKTTNGCTPETSPLPMLRGMSAPPPGTDLNPTPSPRPVDVKFIKGPIGGIRKTSRLNR